ncbi:MAG TPA: hypothetical protein VF530_23250 [Planctomycetota bacterium]
MRTHGLALVAWLDLARPAAAWALLLGPALLLLVRVLARPPEAVTGTLALWRALPEARAGRAGHARFPLWALLAALALTLGALAWLGPRPRGARAPRAWSVVVDRSPSLGLAYAPAAPETRLARALAAAEAWLAGTLEPDETVRWVSPGRAPLVLARGARPPEEWLACDGAEPDWDVFDAPGTLWVTDREPPGARRAAGLFASGGPAVPGAIALEGAASVWWEEGRLALRARPVPPAVRVLEPAGEPLPEVLARLLGAWCDARGFALVRAPAPDELLELALAPGPAAAESLRFGRDGWRATGRAAALAPLAAGSAGEDWLQAVAADGTPRVLVRARTGRVDVALHELGTPEGDPAAFALSWTRLLEGSCRLPADVVPLAERAAAGEERHLAPALPARHPDARAALGPALDAGLALAAGLVAALAFLLRARA